MRRYFSIFPSSVVAIAFVLDAHRTASRRPSGPRPPPTTPQKAAEHAEESASAGASGHGQSDRGRNRATKAVRKQL